METNEFIIELLQAWQSYEGIHLSNQHAYTRIIPLVYPQVKNQRGLQQSVLGFLRHASWFNAVGSSGQLHIWQGLRYVLHCMCVCVRVCQQVSSHLVGLAC